jgi:TPP-dependent trihydroxycyclohexane-1,2-dione (THcHDO) dehydratase
MLFILVAIALIFAIYLTIDIINDAREVRKYTIKTYESARSESRKNVTMSNNPDEIHNIPNKDKLLGMLDDKMVDIDLMIELSSKLPDSLHKSELIQVLNDTKLHAEYGTWSNSRRILIEKDFIKLRGIINNL